MNNSKFHQCSMQMKFEIQMKCKETQMNRKWNATGTHMKCEWNVIEMQRENNWNANETTMKCKRIDNHKDAINYVT